MYPELGGNASKGFDVSYHRMFSIKGVDTLDEHTLLGMAILITFTI